ncbi:MAG: DUF6152 family protein [Bryobacteraceae bacterium]
MKTLLHFGFAIGLLILISVPVEAHHSTAGYDLIHGTIISGMVTRFDWENPHARLFLDVVTEGETEHWKIEMESPEILSRLGWTKDSLKPGDSISVVGSRAKDLSFRMRAGYVQWPDGRKLPSLPPES